MLAIRRRRAAAWSSILALRSHLDTYKHVRRSGPACTATPSNYVRQALVARVS